ncbi:hypothetical protein XENTR_v10009382 [Xenopus tropicalis]|nr:hypothetical protein XENTR_v10009382 [Xenopus tropicalis]
MDHINWHNPPNFQKECKLCLFMGSKRTQVPAGVCLELTNVLVNLWLIILKYGVIGRMGFLGLPTDHLDKYQNILSVPVCLFRYTAIFATSQVNQPLGQTARSPLPGSLHNSKPKRIMGGAVLYHVMLITTDLKV